MRRRAVDLHDLIEFKRNERASWARGDYGTIAREMFWDVGARIVGRLGVRRGDRVLDVACGTGNAAIRAAEAGGTVVGLDLTPELLETAERLATQAGVEVEWIEGDAEDLPFEDESFDVVVSVFGCMFAPRHEVAARELARVLRPGGRMLITSWTPDSSLADIMRTIIGAMPPGPDFVQPPPLWGREDHIRELFSGSGLSLEFARETVEFDFASIEAALALFETAWGPIVEVRELLEAEGRWAEIRSELGTILGRHNNSRDGTLRYNGEYLVTFATA